MEIWITVKDAYGSDVTVRCEDVVALVRRSEDMMELHIRGCATAWMVSSADWENRQQRTEVVWRAQEA